jgi:hypothetical protein
MVYKYEYPYEFIVFSRLIPNIQNRNVDLLDIVFDGVNRTMMNYNDYDLAIEQIYIRLFTLLDARVDIDDITKSSIGLLIGIIDHIILFLTSIKKIGENPIIIMANDNMALLKFRDHN